MQIALNIVFIKPKKRLKNNFKKYKRTDEQSFSSRGGFMKKENIAKSLILLSLCAILLYYVYTLFRIGALISYLLRLIFPLLIALFFHFLIDPIIDYFTNDRLSRKIVVTHLYLSFSLLFIIAFVIVKSWSIPSFQHLFIF